MSATEQRTVTIGEAAKQLGISRNTAYCLAQQGKLPVIRLGRRWLVPKVQLDSLLAGEQGHRREATAR